VSTLVIEHLSGGLAGSPLVEDVSLTIRSGEVHALMGPNGAGKSTLGRLLMGHPGCVATAGSVRLDGV
jgi:Fe-S cluster assembly ATP-binding protein